MQGYDTATRTLWGEARGEPREGQIAVAWVFKNRASHPAWWGRDLEGVCRAPYQFSCRNPKDPNSQKLEALPVTDPVYRSLYEVVVKVMEGGASDPTNGATHYKVKGTKASWDKVTENMQPVEIGHHLFYKLGPST